MKIFAKSGEYLHRQRTSSITRIPFLSRTVGVKTANRLPWKQSIRECGRKVTPLCFAATDVLRIMIGVEFGPQLMVFSAMRQIRMVILCSHSRHLLKQSITISLIDAVAY